MIFVLGLLVGLVVGFIGGGWSFWYHHGYVAGVRASDREWAAMLEQHVVGPTQTVNPFRLRGK